MPLLEVLVYNTPGRSATSALREVVDWFGIHLNNLDPDTNLRVECVLHTADNTWVIRVWRLGE